MESPLYYPGACNVPPEPFDPATLPGLQSTSHEFTGPGTLNLAALQAQSGLGGEYVANVDIDVRSTKAGVPLLRAGGSDTLYENGSRSWCGHVDGDGLHYPASEFTLTLTADDVVVVDWSEWVVP